MWRERSSGSMPQGGPSIPWRVSNGTRMDEPTPWSIRGRSPRPVWCPDRACQASGSSSTTGSASSPGGGWRSMTRCMPRLRPRILGIKALRGCSRVTDESIWTRITRWNLYTKQCSLNVSARDLAVMGATLADGGVNPITKRRVVDASVCHYALAVMTTAGLYETSGDWLYDIGLPGKSGIGGGIVTVSPGKGGLGTFSPLLDKAGNSVKGQLVAKYLSQQLGMDLFVSQPAA